MASDSSAAPTNPVDIEESEKCTASPNCAAKCPFVYNYGPVHMRGLEPGKLYSFCTCGLSKQQPWCDQSHRGTNFRPLQWRCPPDHRQSIYAMCGCKYSQSLPFCDGSHIDLPLKIQHQQQNCKRKQEHSNQRLCEECGWYNDGVLT